MLGGGPVLQAGRISVGADLRIYPTMWSDISGDTRGVVRDGNVMTEQIMESPGGMPITVTLAIGIGF